MIRSWRLIESGFEDSAFNMAVDEALFLKSRRDDSVYPTLRFYGFKPRCVTFGVSQVHEGSRVLAKLGAEGYRLTRRPTGGGIVIHDVDMCYAVIFPSKSGYGFRHPEASYEAIHQAIAAGFRREGIALDFAREGAVSDVTDSVCMEHPVRSDLLYGGRKMAGAAERRSRGHILHQGFISFKPFVRSNAGYFLLFDKMRGGLKKGFEEHFGINLTTGELFREEIDEAVRLANEKYATSDWTVYGLARPVLVPCHI